MKANFATALISDNLTGSVVRLSLRSDVFGNSRVPLTLDGPPVIGIEDVVVTGSQLLHLSLLRSKKSGVQSECAWLTRIVSYRLAAYWLNADRVLDPDADAASSHGASSFPELGVTAPGLVKIDSPTIHS